MRENRQDRTTNVTPAFILGDGVSALGIVRSLGRRGIPVYLFSSERDGIAEQSRYAKTTMLSEPKSHRAIANDLLSAAKGFDQKPVLYYLTDDYLDFVSDNREQLQERFLFPISSRESIECVGKKEKFGLFCAENAVPAPQNFTMDNDAEVMQLLNDAPYPLMIKPSKSLDWQQQEFANKHGWIKVFKVDGPEQLLAAWNKLKGPNTTLMAQEFIPGDDNGHYSYYSYRNSNAVEIANLCVRKSRVLPIHGGNGTFFEPEENHQIQTIATELLDKLGYTGIVSVCFKWNSLTNKPIVHEVNGRMPQGNGAFQACDIDLPYIIYRDMLGEELPLTTPKLNRKFFFFVRDLDAMREYRQAKELRLRDWFRSFGPKPYCAEFAWDDMLPFFWSLRSLLQRSMSKTKKTITAKAQTIGA